MATDFVFVPLYYGRSFAAGQGQGSFTAGDMDNALTTLSKSAYFNPLKAFGVGTVSVYPSNDIAPNDPPAAWSDPNQGFTNDDVKNLITAELDAGRVPKPNTFAQTPAYVVILRQGMFSKDHGDDVGYHDGLTYQNRGVAFAWVMQGDNLKGTTPIASHEMVEIATSALGFGERGDPCAPHAALINDVMAAAYVSATHSCVVPGAYSEPLGSVVWMAWKGMGADQGIYYSWLNGSWQKQLNIPRVGTSDSPALCPHDGTLWLAWKGQDNDQHIYWSTINDTAWERQQVVPDVGTSSHPALASFAGTLYMAWKGIAGDDGIWWTKWLGDHWDIQKNIPSRSTSTGVSLFSSGQLHMAWKGEGNDTGIYTAIFDANTETWSPQASGPGGRTSDTPVMAAEPAFVGDPDKMLMTWKGGAGDQRIFQAVGINNNWSPQEEQRGVKTSTHLALLASGSGPMWRAWKGFEGDEAIWWSQGDEGITWSDQQFVSGVGTSHGPALALFTGGPKPQVRRWRPIR